MALWIGAGLVALVLVAVVVGLARRRGEAHSVEDYRHTLETLQGIQHHPSVRVLKAPGAHEDSPGELAARPGELAARPGELRFEDLGPAEDIVVSSRSAQRSRRSQSRALSSMNHRSRRLGGTIVSAMVVVGVLAAVVAVGASRHPSSPSKGSSRAASAAGRTTTTVARRRTTTVPRRRTTTTTVPRRRTTTTTTVPPKFTPVAATATTATYVPPAASFSVTLVTTTGACWVDVTSSTGATLFTQTLPIGTTKTITASGSTTVILGAPSAIDVSIDHEPVVLPTGFQTPFTMTLQPAAGT